MAQRFKTPILVLMHVGGTTVPVQIRADSIIHFIESETSAPQFVEVQWEGKMVLTFTSAIEETAEPVG
jgi:hypothetical protein